MLDTGLRGDPPALQTLDDLLGDSEFLLGSGEEKTFKCSKVTKETHLKCVFWSILDKCLKRVDNKKGRWFEAEQSSCSMVTV